MIIGARWLHRQNSEQTAAGFNISTEASRYIHSFSFRFCICTPGTVVSIFEPMLYIFIPADLARLFGYEWNTKFLECSIGIRHDKLKDTRTHQHTNVAACAPRISKKRNQFVVSVQLNYILSVRNWDEIDCLQARGMTRTKAHCSLRHILDYKVLPPMCFVSQIYSAILIFAAL